MAIVAWPDERVGIIDRACEGNPDLADEVRSLLEDGETFESTAEDLRDQIVWPALQSLEANPSGLIQWLDHRFKEDPAVEDRLVGSSVSRFDILDPIGRGGMGMVYRAHDRVLGRTVALKFLPPSLNADREAKDLFVHEAKAASGLNNPHIAAILDIGETDDRQMYITMGYYPGESLKALIENGPLSPNKAIELALQLADGMAEAHRHGVIHRDIKPGNLLVTESGALVLLDFGLAKLADESGYTRISELAGTIAYMAPEQARGAAIDGRTDLWAFGIVLYEMLTGRRPFEGDNAQSVLHAILEEDPQPLPDELQKVPEPLKRIIGLCLAKHPDDRYQRAEDIREDLGRAREGLNPKRRGGRSAWKHRSNSRLWTQTGIAAATCLIAVVLVAALGSDSGPRFTRVTEGAIVRDTGHFSSAAWGDYDDDGDLDVAIANDATGGSVYLYRNNGDGTFGRIVDGVIAKDPIAPYSMAWADQDNDGDLDLFVATFQDGAVDAFFRNEGGGQFTRVTDGDWVNTPGWGTSVAWGDYDNDGFVDLYVSNFRVPHAERDYLYHNRGDGTMESVLNAATETPDTSGGALWTDYDGDGDLDLFVAHREYQQFRNDGHGVFTWVSPADGGISWEWDGVSSAFSSANFDNDRDLDLFMTTYEASPNNRLYYNEFKKHFLDVSDRLVSSGLVSSLGSSWGDYDNDGFVDLYVANHGGENLLYHNEGDGTFRRVLDSTLLRQVKPSVDCTWVDYDNDGDLDLLVTNGSWAEFEETCDLFRNEGNANHWIVLSLVGTVSNRSAVGAKVWVRAVVRGRSMAQLREISAGGHGNAQPDPRAHFGLGDAEIVDLVRIEWPSGHVQELSDVAANQFLDIVEHDAAPMDDRDSHLSF